MSRGGGWVRERRTGLVVTAGLVTAVVVVLVLGPGSVRTSGRLDPDNPGPDGGRAVARVLADRGVDVSVVRSADALAAAGAGAGTTVVVTSTEKLGASTSRRLLDDARGARLVVVAPAPGTLGSLGVVGAEPLPVELDGPRRGDCADPAYDGLRLEVDAALAYAGSAGCFRGEGGALLAQPRPDLVLLGADQVLSNEQVLRADNAATALRLLGRDGRLVWYVPDLADLAAGDGVSLATLLPRWLRPALWLLAVASVALLLWRSRRLGPLATEPLPVVVRAIETTRSRGRLYRRAGDRGHAAAALRSAARTRVAERLRLGPGHDPAALVRDVARLLDRPVDEVDALLGADAPAPTTDHDLITLAGRLAALDREVRRA
jgi:hypothetical protein